MNASLRQLRLLQQAKKGPGNFNAVSIGTKEGVKQGKGGVPEGGCHMTCPLWNSWCGGTSKPELPLTPLLKCLDIDKNAVGDAAGPSFSPMFQPSNCTQSKTDDVLPCVKLIA